MGMTLFSYSVRSMRILCPLLFVVCLVVGYFAWTKQMYFVFAVDLFLAAVNAVLSWINWMIFTPQGARK